MLVAENNLGGLDPTVWMGIGGVITAAGAFIARVTGVWKSAQRIKDRDAIADYQKLYDAAVIARDRMEQAKDKMVTEMIATLTENLHLKALNAEKDEQIAALQAAQKGKN